MDVIRTLFELKSSYEVKIQMLRIVVLCALLVSLAVSIGWAAEMTGYITCSKCRHTQASQMDCAKNCIRSGVPALFYDTATDKFYKVENQEAAKPHAGEQVTVTGTVDGETLRIESIKSPQTKKAG